MNLKQKRDGEKLTIFIDGRIDTNTAPTLNDYLEKELPGAKDLTLDIEKVDYISSAGLRVLLVSKKSIDAKGGRMIVKNANNNIMDIFTITGFATILEFE